MFYACYHRDVIIKISHYPKNALPLSSHPIHPTPTLSVPPRFNNLSLSLPLLLLLHYHKEDQPPHSKSPYKSPPSRPTNPTSQHLIIHDKIRAIRNLGIQQLRPMVEILRMPIHPISPNHRTGMLIDILNQHAPNPAIPHRRVHE